MQKDAAPRFASFFGPSRKHERKSAWYISKNGLPMSDM